MRPTLYDFGQCESLLTCITLYLLGIRVVFFELFKLLGVILQNRNDRFQFGQLIAMLLNKACRFLGFIQAFANFVHAIGERIICQQIQSRQQAVQGRDALFRLFKLHTLLLVIIFMIGQRTFQF